MISHKIVIFYHTWVNGRGRHIIYQRNNILVGQDMGSVPLKNVYIYVWFVSVIPECCHAYADVTSALV